MKRIFTGAALLNGALVLGMAAAGAAVLSQLPGNAMLATHFGLDGTPDSFAPAAQGVFMLPAIGAFVWLVMVFVPAIDPRGNLERSPQAFRVMWSAVTALLAVYQALILRTGLGGDGPGLGFAIGSLGAMLAVMGNQMGKLRPNFFVGIRTPWTLSSDAVWTRTHRFGGFSVVAAGLICVAASLTIHNPKLLLPLAAGVVVVALLLPMAWSYKLWREEARG